MITYKPTEYSGEIRVYLEGKFTGTIHQTTDNQFQYWPKGPRAKGGDKFPTLALCKRSLEG
jgi:hypothetical protein